MQFKIEQIGYKRRPHVVSAANCRRLFALSVPLCLCLSVSLSGLAAYAADAGFNQAVAMYNAGKYSVALAQFQTVSQKYPSDPLTRYYMALCYQHLNQVGQAQSLYTWVEKYARSPGLKEKARAGLDSMNQYSSARSHPGSAPPPAPPAADAKGPDGKPVDPKAPPKAADAKADKGALKCKKAIQFTSSSSNDQRTLQLFGPFWDSAQEKFKGKVDFQLVDVDNAASADLVKKYAPSTYPHIVYLDKDGKMLGSTPGASGDISSTIEGFK